MLPEFEKNMKETQSYDIILDTLTILRRLFRSKEELPDFSAFFKHYQKILQMILLALDHDYSKVVSEGLRVAASYVFILRDASCTKLDA